MALARAVVNNPAVLLLDEPLGALDLKLRRQMQVELKRIQNEVGLTFVHVTHDQEEAMTMADTVAVMNAGRIEQLGAPQDLYDLPRTAFVANFLGRSNLVPGTVVDAATACSASTSAARGCAARRAARSRTEGDGPRRRPAGEGAAAHRRRRRRRPAPTCSAPGTVMDVSFCGVSTEYLVDVPGLGDDGASSRRTSPPACRAVAG